MHQDRNSLTVNSDFVTVFSSLCWSLIYHCTCIDCSSWRTGWRAFIEQLLGSGSAQSQGYDAESDMLRSSGSSWPVAQTGVDWRGELWPPAWGGKNHGDKGRVWCCLEESIKDSGRIQYMKQVWKNELGFGVQRSENSQSKNKGMCDLLWLRQGTGSMARAEDEKSAPTSKCQTKRVLPKLRKGNLLTKF